MKLNKGFWKNVEYGQLVDHIEINERDPEKRALAKYVSVEHLDTLDLRIKGIAEEEQPTFSRTFKKGQILFAKRRAYQKKVAVADFDGICSPHIWALESKGELLQGLLPFIMQRDAFYEYVNANSAGTMSTYLKWPALSKYQFKLPPKDEQEKILSIFLTLEKQIQQTEEQEKHQRKLAKKIIDDFIDNNRFGDLLNDEILKEYTWKDCVNKLLLRTDAVSDGIKRIVAGENLESEDFKIRTWGIVGKDFLGPAFHVMFEPGDILYGSRRTYLRKVSLADFRGVCANTTFVVRAKEDLLLQDLLKHIMLSERFTQYSIAKSKGSTNPYINWKDLDDFTFKLPDIESQKKMVEILDGCIDLAEKARTQAATLKKLKYQLLDEILG